MRHTNYLMKYLSVQMQAYTEKTFENCYIEFHGPMVGFYRDEETAPAEADPAGIYIPAVIKSVLIFLIPMTQLISIEEIENAGISKIHS